MNMCLLLGVHQPDFGESMFVKVQKKNIFGSPRIRWKNSTKRKLK